MVFRSKVDAWLVLVIALAALPAFGYAVVAYRSGGDWAPHAAIGVAVVLLLLAMLFPTRYTVSDKELLVRCGLLRWHIDPRTISRITPSRSFVSGPALSLDRLKLDFANGRRPLLVSPADQQAFIGALRETMPAR